MVNLAIRSLAGALPTQDIGYPWSLEAVDSVTGVRPAGVQWGFAPLPFISFVGNTNVGGVINLEPQDLGDNPIAFACQAPVTQITATAPLYTPAQQTINSRSPQNPFGQALMTQPVVYTDGTGHTWLRLGPQDEVGIEIDVSATPNGTTGDIAAIQLLNTVRTFTKADGQTETKTTQGQWVLDVAAGQNTFLYLDRIRRIDQALQISDSPAQELGGPFVHFQVNENFRTYIMFRTNAPNANWMPLYLVRWGWIATAALDGGTWVLQSGAAVQPVEGPTQSFPFWQANITEFHYGPGAAVTDRAVRSPSRDGARSSV